VQFLREAVQGLDLGWRQHDVNPFRRHAKSLVETTDTQRAYPCVCHGRDVANNEGGSL
jgi:hypothetical protein